MTTLRDKWIFVPNKSTHDYTEAWKFGTLVFCTDGPVNRKDVKTMYEELVIAMEDAREDDYILLSSLSSLCSVSCAIFAARFKRLNLLIFEKGEYLERFITLE